MSKRPDEKKYEGNIFGFTYAVDFDTDEEFVAWIVESLKKISPLLPKIMDGLLNESAEFQEVKDKLPREAM